MMLTERGIVKDTFNHRALVVIRRSTWCDSCASQGICRALSGKEMLVEAFNELNAKPGDRVELILPPTGSLLKISLFVYLLPILALMIAATLGWHYGPLLNLNRTLASVGASALALGICFSLLHVLDYRLGKRNHLTPRIMRIVPASDEALPDDNK